MKRSSKKYLLVAAALGLLALEPQSFTYFGSPPRKGGGPPNPRTSGGDVNWYFHELGTEDIEGGPLTNDGETTVMTTALNDWEVATGGNLDLEYVGATTQTP